MYGPVNNHLRIGQATVKKSLLPAGGVLTLVIRYFCISPVVLESKITSKKIRAKVRYKMEVEMLSFYPVFSRPFAICRPS
jgi:hypothetical protein